MPMDENLLEHKMWFDVFYVMCILNRRTLVLIRGVGYTPSKHHDVTQHARIICCVFFTG